MSNAPNRRSNLIVADLLRPFLSFAFFFSHDLSQYLYKKNDTPPCRARQQRRRYIILRNNNQSMVTSLNISRLSRALPEPRTTDESGSSATMIGMPVASFRHLSRFFRRAPPPVGQSPDPRYQRQVRGASTQARP